MNPPDPSRRRFLALLAGLAGAGVTAGWALAARGTDPKALAEATTTSPAPTTTSTPVTTIAETETATTTTTRAPTTTTTTAPATTRTAGPSTTSPPPSTTVAPPTTTVVLTSSGDVQAICKTAWGGREAAGDFTNHTIERMTVHHTAAVLDANRKAPARVRQHQRFHIDDRGWPDLAYHFIVDANGNVYEGRPVTAVGDTGTNYDPTGHFLVCAEGNFDQHDIPAAQVAAVVDLLAWGAVQFGVDASTIKGHRDWASTSCPGDRFYPLISGGNLEQAVRNRVAAGAPAVSILCGDPAVQLVADIEAGIA